MHVARYPVALTAPPRLVERRGLCRELVFGALLAGFDALVFTAIYLFLLDWKAGFPGANLSLNLGPLLLCLASIYGIFVATNRYHLRTDMGTVRFAAEHGLACLCAFLLALLLQFAVFIFDFSRSRMVLFLAFLIFTPIVLASRRIISRRFRVRAELQSLLVIGSGPVARGFYRACLQNQLGQRLRFVDLSGRHVGESVGAYGSPVIEGGWWNDFSSLLDASVEAIILAEPFPQLPLSSIETLIRTHFYHAPILTLEAFYERYWRKVPVVTDPFWALRQDFRLARDSSYRFFKRGIDIVLALFGLLVSLPLLLGCACAIACDSGFPVLYRQQRIRRDRETFTLYKLRSMQVTQETGEDIYTRECDGRVTPVGRWLRLLRIDELPQLWNVLKGDMSLIGPRAEWDRCANIYEREIPCYHFRHLVKPGITGWAQVNYPYGQSVEDAVEKLKYDLYYIKNYSLLLDASIVLKTLYVILSCKGR